jgi:hypothetical protein
MSPKLFKTFSWIVLIVGAGAVISGTDGTGQPVKRIHGPR